MKLALRLLATIVLPLALLSWGLALSALLFLGILGAVAAHTGGASLYKGALRVCLWGASAMALTAWVGSFFQVLV